MALGPLAVDRLRCTHSCPCCHALLLVLIKLNLDVAEVLLRSCVPAALPLLVLVAQADDPDASSLLDCLGVDVLPTVQFWRNGKLLWEHRGVNQLEQNMGEGVLYFGDR